MRVIVVGGGIGGVALAVALIKEGHDPLVIEQAPALTEVGGGLVVAPNAKKALNYLGCGEQISAMGVRTEETVFYDMEGGDRIFTTRMGSVSVARYGEYNYTMHRADLLEALLTRLPPKHVKLNAVAASVEEDGDGASVLLASGERIAGDMVVGADGIRSRVRATLFGESEPTPTGLLGWRALIPVEDAPHIAPLPRNVLWFGPGRHVGVYPVRPDKLLNLFAWVPAEEVERESWMLSGDVADLRSSLAGACRELATIVESIQQAFITPLYLREALPRWSTSRITLLGDAAHPATAAAGQGAAMALEDAVTLAICVRGCSGGSDLAAALRDYEQRRIPRTSRMQAISLNNLGWMNESDPDQRRARNGRFRGIQRLDPVGATPWVWLFSHDAAKAAELPLADALPQAGSARNDRRRVEATEAFEAWATVLTAEDRARLWVGEREGYERFIERIDDVPDGTAVDRIDANGVPALLVGSGSGPTVLHLHGGGFTMGSAVGSIGLGARIAAAIDGRVVIPDYRLAPEHPFPAALDDAVTVYRWMLEQPAMSAVVVSGEDAGGGLAVSLAAALRDERDPLPGGLMLVSPMVDLALKSPSIDEAQDHEPWSSRERLTMFSAAYIQDHDPNEPRLSPVYEDLKGLPPMRIHVAADEALLGDAERLAGAAGDAGVDVELVTVADSVHSFILFPRLAESRVAVEQLRDLCAVVAS